MQSKSVLGDKRPNCIILDEASMSESVNACVCLMDRSLMTLLDVRRGRGSSGFASCLRLFPYHSLAHTHTPSSHDTDDQADGIDKAGIKLLVDMIKAPLASASKGT